MASSPIVWTPDKRMILQSAVSDLSPDAFQDVVGKVFGPATLAIRPPRPESSPAPPDTKQGRGDLSERQQTLNGYLSELKKIAQAFRVAVVVTNQVMAIPDQFALGAPQVKSCGGPVMAHNTNTKIFLKRAGRGRKKAVLQHSPFMPYGDCEFSITAAGVVDAVDG